eukprot:Amastigsp_a182306_30.p3 type:complete len:204 gc:universal Amastigsp_a182306_30:97-708(+)
MTRHSPGTQLTPGLRAVSAAATMAPANAARDALSPPPRMQRMTASRYDDAHSTAWMMFGVVMRRLHGWPKSDVTAIESVLALATSARASSRRARIGRTLATNLSAGSAPETTVSTASRIDMPSITRRSTSCMDTMYATDSSLFWVSRMRAADSATKASSESAPSAEALAVNGIIRASAFVCTSVVEPSGSRDRATYAVTTALR